MSHPTGIYGMHCFNALSEEQKYRVVVEGVLPFPWSPAGGFCRSGAEVEIYTKWDQSPGPRFYCNKCAIEFLQSLNSESLQPTNGGG